MKEQNLNESKKYKYDITGFSILELIVVILVVGVLATISVIGYRKVVEAAKDKQVLMAISAIVEAQNRYRLSSTNQRFATVSELLSPSPYTGQPYLNQSVLNTVGITGTDYRIIRQEVPSENSWGMIFFSASYNKCYCVFEDGGIRTTFNWNRCQRCSRDSEIVTY